MGCQDVIIKIFTKLIFTMFNRWMFIKLLQKQQLYKWKLVQKKDMYEQNCNFGKYAIFERNEKCKELIEKKGFTVILLEEDNWDKITPEQINNFKRIVSKRYFDIIADANTTALLVVNSDKKRCKELYRSKYFC